AGSWLGAAGRARGGDAVALTACNLLRWQHMMLMVLRATDDAEWKLFVEFEALVREPGAQARRLARFLDRRFGRTADEPRLAVIASAVDPSLRRNRFDRPLDEVPESSVAQRDLYRFLRR